MVSRRRQLSLAFSSSSPLGTTGLTTSLACKTHPKTPRQYVPLVRRRLTPVAIVNSTIAGTSSGSSVPIRVGHGFDLHRLEEGHPLVLGGVRLEHDRGCVSHSDGDAVFHCVVDAILGALCLPDIGQLFPDSDPRFKDCESHVFMTAAYERMRQEKFVIGNIDVTVILEKPKMSPHKLKMRENMAELLHTPLKNVNLKAKTHEKVDAVGENRAVSVHAVATLVHEDSILEENIASAQTVDLPSVGQSATEAILDMVTNRVSDIQEITAPAKINVPDEEPVQRLYDTVCSRKGADPDSSWTARLFSKGRSKIAQKVGEEAVEVVIDAIKNDKSSVIKESADLLYHLCVLWADVGIAPKDVWQELASREGMSGITEKAARKSS